MFYNGIDSTSVFSDSLAGVGRSRYQVFLGCRWAVQFADSEKGNDMKLNPVWLVLGVAGGLLLDWAAGTDTPANLAWLALIVGLALLGALAFMLYRQYRPGNYQPSPDEVPFIGSTFARFLRRARDAAYLYLGIRIFLGWQWIDAGWHKITDPAWLNGAAIRGYWERAVTIPEEGRAAISYPIYRSFLQGLLDADANSWFGPLIAYSEFLVGLAIILGALTAIAAFGGIMMNFAFLYAGSASSNPTLLLFGLLLTWGWRVAGWIGLDRWILPLVTRVKETVGPGPDDPSMRPRSAAAR
jgi:thiosulfate dehydrogenase [quinone] large subunit